MLFARLVVECKYMRLQQMMSLSWLCCIMCPIAHSCALLVRFPQPAAELQAIDRCHRLGQYRPIRAVRFVAEGTVEERVLQLQDKKRLVFDGTVGRDAGSLKMLTVDDMKALFA